MLEQHFQKYDVFLNYRTVENKLCRLIKSELEKENLTIFLDKDELGQCLFIEKLEQSIKDCRNFIVILTDGYIERCVNDPNDYCLFEIDIALRSNINIVVIVDDGVALNVQDHYPAGIKKLLEINTVKFDHIYFDAFRKELLSRLDLTSTLKRINEDWNAMEEVMRSEAYRDWQLNQIRTTYASQLPESDSTAAPGAPIIMPTVAGKTYPIICYHAADSSIPFEQNQLCFDDFEFRHPNNLPDLNSNPNAEIPPWVTSGTSGSIRTRYFEMLSYTKRVRRWNMRGFALSSLQLDADQRVTGYKARLISYGENCLTSHIIGYELYHRYMHAITTNAIESASMFRPAVTILERPTSKAGDVLTIPENDSFLPLISVQGLVVYRNKSEGNTWKLLAMERGNKSASASGFWQFPPAGGFEIFGTEDGNLQRIENQFDMRLALIREFLEEIFGDVDMTCEDQEFSKSAQEGSRGYKAVIDSINEGLMRIHFLGVVTDLVSLRSEFSFLIVVEDPKIFGLDYEINDPENGKGKVQWLHGSALETKSIDFINLDKVSRLFRPFNVWNPSSVGLIKLFAELTQDEQGWLKTLYPDMPTIRL